MVSFVRDCSGVLPTSSVLCKIGFPCRVNYAQFLAPCGLAREIGRPTRASPMPVSSQCAPTGARRRGSWSVPAGGCPLGQGNCGPPRPIRLHLGAGRRCPDLRTVLWGLIPHPLCDAGWAFLLEGVYSDQTPLPGPGRSSRPGLTSRIWRLPRGTPDRLHPLPSVSSLRPAPLGRPVLPERIACSPCLSPVLPARCP